MWDAESYGLMNHEQKEILFYGMLFILCRYRAKWIFGPIFIFNYLSLKRLNPINLIPLVTRAPFCF